MQSIDRPYDYLIICDIATIWCVILVSDSPQLYDSKACKRFRQQPLGEGLLHPGNGGPYIYPHTNAQLNFYEATRNLRDDIPGSNLEVILCGNIPVLQFKK